MICKKLEYVLFLKYGDDMNKIKKALVVNLLIIFVSVFLFKGISYSIDVENNKNNKDLLIKTGNMQVVLNIPNEKYELIDSSKNIVSDSVGMNSKGYKFSIKNTGNIPIEYYEIRLVNQEGRISTLPHKYLRYIISHDNIEDSVVKNLGDNDSIIYSGNNLEIGDSTTFNLKMWISDLEIDAYGKELYGAIEVTLYQKYEVYKNYVLYESVDSTNVPVRTSIYSPITSTIPKKEGYRFGGWKTKDGKTLYNSGDTYKDNIGQTLYAIWEKEL